MAEVSSSTALETQLRERIGDAVERRLNPQPPGGCTGLRGLASSACPGSPAAPRSRRTSCQGAHRAPEQRSGPENQLAFVVGGSACEREGPHWDNVAAQWLGATAAVAPTGRPARSLSPCPQAKAVSTGVGSSAGGTPTTPPQRPRAGSDLACHPTGRGGKCKQNQHAQVGKPFFMTKPIDTPSLSANAVRATWLNKDRAVIENGRHPQSAPYLPPRSNAHKAETELLNSCSGKCEGRSPPQQLNNNIAPVQPDEISPAPPKKAPISDPA